MASYFRKETMIDIVKLQKSINTLFEIITDSEEQDRILIAVGNAIKNKRYQDTEKKIEEDFNDLGIRKNYSLHFDTDEDVITMDNVERMSDY